MVSLPAGVTEVHTQIATLSCQLTSPSVQDQIEGLDLSLLPLEEKKSMRTLLRKYTPVFSAHDIDLGCTNLISHDIPLVDEVPERQHYRHIPTLEYEVLAVQVGQESRSPYASPIVLVKKKDGNLRRCVRLFAALHFNFKLMPVMVG